MHKQKVTKSRSRKLYWAKTVQDWYTTIHRVGCEWPGKTFPGPLPPGNWASINEQNTNVKERNWIKKVSFKTDKVVKPKKFLGVCKEKKSL